MKISQLTGLAVVAFALAGCGGTVDRPVTAGMNQLTQGNVTMNLRVGQTTQAEVLEVFGAPNITTVNGQGEQVWSYQRHATVSQSESSANGWTVLLAGGSSEAANLARTQRTMTLIIKFDENNVVSDFRSRASEF
ncbi:hypothetical protein [Sphingomicrobium arenosum]|uniref:hypothetical protein n=1 Tax=Sphingomicrobium arenosum TaxID=2233861 RepID=UPI002240F8B7|nr:hypothetical protein [Sphingomicrobium arenosum]